MDADDLGLGEDPIFRSDVVWSVPWDDAVTSDPIGDIRAWVDFIANDVGVYRPFTYIVSDRNYRDLRALDYIRVKTEERLAATPRWRWLRRSGLLRELGRQRIPARIWIRYKVRWRVVLPIKRKINSLRRRVGS